jgi:hypothetical protein
LYSAKKPAVTNNVNGPSAQTMPEQFHFARVDPKPAMNSDNCVSQKNIYARDRSEHFRATPISRAGASGRVTGRNKIGSPIPPASGDRPDGMAQLPRKRSDCVSPKNVSHKNISIFREGHHFVGELCKLCRKILRFKLLLIDEGDSS